MGENPLLGNTNKKRPKIIFIGVVVIILLGTIIAGFASGRLYVGMKEPGQKVQLTYQVCGNDIIQKHNSFYFPLDKEDQAAMDAMVKDIVESSGYADDATCQAILFSAALENDNVDGMQKSLDALEKLTSRGKAVDGSLRNTYSIDAMRASLEETINEKKASNNE